jgi:hypothetical protein
MSEEELPKLCPACGSYQFVVRNWVKVPHQQIWGKGGDNRQRYIMFPCTDDWHNEGLAREWASLSEQEQKRIVQSIKKDFPGVFDSES